MYTVIETVKRNEETEYTTYGIAMLRDNCAEIILSDISPDIGFVNSLVEKCNTFGAAPKHVTDIVYDSIV